MVKQLWYTICTQSDQHQLFRLSPSSLLHYYRILYFNYNHFSFRFKSAFGSGVWIKGTLCIQFSSSFMTLSFTKSKALKLSWEVSEHNRFFAFMITENEGIKNIKMCLRHKRLSFLRLLHVQKLYVLEVLGDMTKILHHLYPRNGQCCTMSCF